MRVSTVVLAVLLWLAAVPVLFAQGTPTTAQQWFERGVELTKAEQWAEAQASFEASLALEARAATYLNLAIVRYRLGAHVPALTALEAVERDVGLQPDVKQRAAWLREKLAEHVVRFQLRVEPAESLVQIDGEAQPGTGLERQLWLTPGQHEVVATAEGYNDASLSLVATAGQATTAAMRLKLAVVSSPALLASDVQPVSAAPPAPADQVPARRPLWKNPWLWTAVGVVVVGGAVAAGVLLGADDDPKPARCDPAKDFCI